MGGNLQIASPSQSCEFLRLSHLVLERRWDLRDLLRRESPLTVGNYEEPRAKKPPRRPPLRIPRAWGRGLGYRLAPWPPGLGLVVRCIKKRPFHSRAGECRWPPLSSYTKLPADSRVGRPPLRNLCAPSRPAFLYSTLWATARNLTENFCPVRFGNNLSPSRTLRRASSEGEHTGLGSVGTCIPNGPCGWRSQMLFLITRDPPDALVRLRNFKTRRRFRAPITARASRMGSSPVRSEGI